MGTIVVGVDGSENGQRALRWALTQAAAVDDRVIAAQAWSVPTMVYGGAGYIAPFNPADVERSAGSSLAAAIGDLTDGVPAGVELEQRVLPGQPAAALIAEAERSDAVLLVVGSRGRGGFAGLLLGSVSASLAHHTPCPLVIVPAPTAV